AGVRGGEGVLSEAVCAAVSDMAAGGGSDVLGGAPSDAGSAAPFDGLGSDGLASDRVRDLGGASSCFLISSIFLFMPTTVLISSRSSTHILTVACMSCSVPAVLGSFLTMRG